MHGFGFFPLFWPVVIFGGLLKLLFFVLLIALIVRVLSRGHRHGYAHGRGYGWHHDGYGPENLDPRRVAAWRFAAGQIDLAEFDRIMAGLNAQGAPTAGTTTPPSTPAAPVA